MNILVWVAPENAYGIVIVPDEFSSEFVAQSSSQNLQKKFSNQVYTHFMLTCI